MPVPFNFCIRVIITKCINLQVLSMEKICDFNIQHVKLYKETVKKIVVL